MALSDDAVVALCRGGTGCATCTATLVGAETVLTAAHCVDDSIESDTIDQLAVFFGGNVAEAGTWIYADAAVMHRYFDPETLLYDIAMIHLSQPAPTTVTPVALNEDPITQDDDGAAIRLVGFGETGYGVNDYGVKRQVDSVITAVAPQHLFVGSEEQNTCKGDSGGPTFYDRGNGEVQIGVTSRSRACAANSVKIRVDVFLDEFVYPFIDRYEGPCALDGNCQTSCPRTPDPDCDPCSFDGECATGCPQADWDCPLGKAIGDACADAGECEFRICQSALDDDRIQYCSRDCDPADPFLCPGGMECTDPDGNGPRCVWPDPTPGALGSACGVDDACRSGICEKNICVELCDQVAGGSCPDPYECHSSDRGEVCGPASGDGGGCSAAGGAGMSSAWWLLLALVAVRRRRGRSAGSC